MNMQKKTALILISVLGILFGIGWLLGHAYANKLTPALAQSNLPDGNVLKQDLAKENWTFEPLDPAKLNASGITQTVLTRDQAIAIANNQFPNLQETKSLIGITANLGKLSNSLLRSSAQAGEKVDPTFLNPRLVWIVTYVGVNSQSVGSPNGPQATSNEFDVVVDATTGEQLMTFVWTR
jgi:peptidase YpeB-like protein